MQIIKETNWLHSSYSTKIQRGFKTDDGRWHELFIDGVTPREEANKLYEEFKARELNNV